MSRSRGKLHKAQCCPWCGTRTIVRDGFEASNHLAYTSVNYICTVCFAGFTLRESPRAQFVNRMYQLERAHRPQDSEHVLARQPGARPLSDRSLFELTRLEELLQAKSPASHASRKANTEQLINVRAELMRRKDGEGSKTTDTEASAIDQDANPHGQANRETLAA